MIPWPFHPEAKAESIIWDASRPLPNAPVVNHLSGSVMASNLLRQICLSHRFRRSTRTLFFRCVRWWDKRTH